MEKLSHFCQLAILIAILSIVSLATYAQDATKKHIVERGETIESIAQQYGTTVDELVKLNPDAAQFVYVGMELVVPEKEISPIVNNNHRDVSNTAKKSEEDVQYTNTSYSGDNEQSKWSYAFSIDYGFLRFGDKNKVNNSSFGYRFAVGAIYQFSNDWYVSANIGWQSYRADTTPKGSKSCTTDVDCITVPLSVGYSFNDGSWMSLSPYIGLEFDYAIKGKVKQNGETASKEVDDVTNTRFGALVSVGAHICKFVNVSYNYELSNMFGKKLHMRYLAIGIGTSF